MPKWTKDNGKPVLDRITALLTDKVSAEVFHCHKNNNILPPSVHEFDNFVYSWTRVGEVPELPWKEIEALAEWVIPGKAGRTKGRPRKAPPWHHRFLGNLASLDLVKLLGELGILVQLHDATDRKYKIRCPWELEHGGTDKGNADTSTVIWQSGDPHWPIFKCLHSHCAERSLEQLLTWAEEQQPGIVDKYCSQQRIWTRGQRSLHGLPRVLHPVGQLDSVVYAEIANIVAPHYVWFLRGDQVVHVTEVPAGFQYTGDAEQKYKITAYTTGYRSLTGLEAKSALEKYIEPGCLNPEGGFIKDSFSPGFTAGMLVAPQFREGLPRILRILTIPLPIRIGNKLVYPTEGYDPRFGTYLVPDAPKLVHPLPTLREAKQIIDSTLSGFCFTSQQSRVHAIARTLTPFARGIFGWDCRVPFWIYCANRARAGKDYLAGVASIIFEGAAYEDAPVGKDAAETGKRIMAAAQAGRRFMHFSNCVGYLADEQLCGAITNPKICGRMLGSNTAAADLSVTNELEFSISANPGLNAREDFILRARKIELAYYDEDPNARTFPNRKLHEYIKQNRAIILSALASIFNHWAKEKFPIGTTPFASFHAWSEIIGGVMQAAGLGDPCQPFKGTFDIGDDPELRSIGALWEEAQAAFQPPIEAEKSDLYDLIDSSDTGDLDWFGKMSDPRPPH
jgi:hypothetical protein